MNVSSIYSWNIATAIVGNIFDIDNNSSVKYLCIYFGYSIRVEF